MSMFNSSISNSFPCARPIFFFKAKKKKKAATISQKLPVSYLFYLILIATTRDSCYSDFTDVNTDIPKRVNDSPESTQLVTWELPAPAFLSMIFIPLSAPRPPLLCLGTTVRRHLLSCV